jgi:hypothetical protein
VVRANFFQDLNAVDLRHHNVKEHSVEALLFDHVQRRQAAMRLGGLKTMCAEIPDQQVSIFRYVVDDEQLMEGALHHRISANND